ncbi:TetR/AcrR family transcriptional regulator [Lysinibacillus sp. 3P01SB]|uniref:TetR/AcrR family transcriptional regulator n=1 Tax=Lysinibacillus sp. 3P01SB TaxID=3132284 RepID=UPI0039A6A5B2
MPKIVDVAERKKAIAEATWQVILEKGMEGATVRNIAKEAGLSLGALRHYFSNQDELLVYAMNLVTENVNQRIGEVLKEDMPIQEQVLKVLLQTLPIEQQSMLEMEVWFAYVASVKHKNEERNIPFNALLTGMEKIIHVLSEFGFLKEGVDLDMEIERLYAVVDGLAVHALFESKRLDRTRVIRTLVYHLNSILKNEAALKLSEIEV